MENKQVSNESFGQKVKRLTKLGVGIFLGVIVLVIIMASFGENSTPTTNVQPNIPATPSPTPVVEKVETKTVPVSTKIEKKTAPVTTQTPIPTKTTATAPKSDRVSVLAILKVNASAKWKDDYQMVQYEYNNQVQAYDWVIAQTKYPAIMSSAEKKWGNDYQMVKYEYENQVEAYEWITAQTAYPNIMAKAKQKWGTDYQMVKYEYSNQVTAYEGL